MVARGRYPRWATGISVPIEVRWRERPRARYASQFSLQVVHQPTA